MRIPWQEIPADSLTNMISEFVSRDGTDYGEIEIPLSSKIEQVRQLLKKGEVWVVYDEASESVALMNREQLPEEYRQESDQ